MKTRVKTKSHRFPNVRPLTEREKITDTRKGMIKQNELVNRSWLEKQMDLFFS